MDHPDSFDKLKPYLPSYLGERLAPDLPRDLALLICQQVLSLRKVLSTYLPRHLVEMIHEDPTPGQGRWGIREGAVIFADVSGFTAMSEKLSVLGKEGAEEITGIVNEYFEAMLEISDDYGGDLLKFGGDALLIFFEGSEGSHRALATGLTMRAAMTRFRQVETSQGVFPLRMKIGMGSGAVFLTSIGSVQKMEYAVMGRALANMALAEEKAVSGQIVVDGAVREAVQDVADFSPLEGNFWLLEEVKSQVAPKKATAPQRELVIPAATCSEDMLQGALEHLEVIEALKPYVPEELLSRLIVDPRRPILGGSHRPVTMMFANFYGIDEIIDRLGRDYGGAVTEILNTHFVKMNKVLTRYGGTVSRLDTYTIGHRIMALFGALRAHEDDPQRAVRAAFEMNQALEEVNRSTRETLAAIPDLDADLVHTSLKQRIGVNTGFVFAGNVGSSNRREYTVMGDQVNLTARLMSLAQEWQVLVGQSTARHANKIFDLEEREAVKVKGKTDPVRNYLVKRVRDRSEWERLSEGPLVGREVEVKRGLDAVEKASRGEGCVLVIKGDSGIGKTRIGEEIAQHAEQEGFNLLVGTCLSYGRTMTYHPWADILRTCFGIHTADETMGAQARVDALQRGMTRIGEVDWMPVIGAIIGLDIPDNELTRDLDAKLRRQRALDLIVKLLRTNAQMEPLMVVVEDAHWGDPASLDVIDYVARNVVGYPILFVLLHRTDEGLPDWAEQPHAIDIPLSGLSDEACLEIVREMVGPVDFPEAMEELILSKAGGNPFFLMEVVRALIDMAALVQDDTGGWQVVDRIEQVDLPDTVHGVIISRIDRLLETDRRLLQAASVVGRRFELRVLSGVYTERDIKDLLSERLRYLADLGITEPRNIELEIHRFVHLTTREVVYESLAYKHRRDLHCRIGDFIEDLYAEDVSEYTNLLAYHYYEGQAWEKALDYNLRSARRSQREYANDTAIDSCQRVLTAGAKLPSKKGISEDILAAHEILGEVLTLVGRYDEALKHYTSARNILQRRRITPERQAHLADLHRKTADVYERQSEYDTAFEWLEKGLEHLDEDQVLVEIADIYLMGAGVFHRQAKNEQASQWCQKSRDIASKIESREARRSLAQAYYLDGAVQYRLGNLPDAVKLCNQSLEIYQDINHAVGEARAYINLSNAYADLGEWDKALNALEESLQINQRIGNVQEQGLVANNLAYIHLERGEWDQAEQLFIESNQIWKRIGAAFGDAITLSNQAQVYIYQKNWEQAKEALTDSEDLFAKIGSDDYLAELERRWGEYYLGIGDLEQALEHTRQSIELAEDQEARLDLGLSQRVLGEIFLQKGDYDRAQNALQTSLSILQELGSDYEAAKTVLVLARLAHKKGAVVDREPLRQAIQTFEELEAKADLIQANTLLELVG